MRLIGCGIRSMRPILKTEMLFYQLTAYLNEKILLRKIIHQLDPAQKLGK